MTTIRWAGCVLVCFSLAACGEHAEKQARDASVEPPPPTRGTRLDPSQPSLAGQTTHASSARFRLEARVAPMSIAVSTSEHYRIDVFEPGQGAQ